MRTINQFYGTHYTPDDLTHWREAEIAEALEYARMMMETPNAQRND